MKYMIFFYRSISFLKYENYNEMLKETQRSLKKIPIGSNVVVQSYYTWINTIFNFVRKIRFEDKLYLLKMCLSDKPLKNNEYFVRMLNLIGGPLIKHNDCYYKFQNGKVDVEFGFARMQVQNVLFGGIQKCDLYEWCRNRCANVNCLKEPWLRSTENQLCYFGTLWKSLGLTNFEPIFH